MTSDQNVHQTRNSEDKFQKLRFAKNLWFPYLASDPNEHAQKKGNSGTAFVSYRKCSHGEQKYLTIGMEMDGRQSILDRRISYLKESLFSKKLYL